MTVSLVSTPLGAILQDFHKRFLSGKYILGATLFRQDHFAFHNEKWTMCARP